jgi:hypothetical protein
MLSIIKMYLKVSNSVAEPQLFDPAPGTNFEVSPATAPIGLYYTKPTFLNKREKEG